MGNKLKRYSQLFEADIKDNKGVPIDYINDVEEKGRDKYGYNGPSHTEGMEMMRAMQDIMRIQYGKENELAKIGKEIIINQYGEILDGVKLDIKIVKPDDEEKLEMTNRMLDVKKDEEIQTIQHDVPENTINIDINEVDKRKILNNLMQGEAQNVASLLHYGKDKIDAIDSDLFDNYVKLLTINKKFDWLDSANLEDMMKQNPEMANAEEVDWEEKDGESIPVIKVRALDLPMLIHETVKGIYELIMAHAIPENPEMAKNIMEQTDTLTDEKEDIKFGPFIAADIRDYIVDYLKRNESNSQDIVNIKEFIYGEMAIVKASKFVKLIYFILDNNIEEADKMMKSEKIVKNAIESATGDNDDNDNDDVETIEIAPKKTKSFMEMSKGELNNAMNDALENDDFDTMKKIQRYLNGDISARKETVGKKIETSKVKTPKVEEPKKDSSSYEDMSKDELQSLLNKMIADENYEEAQKIQKLL